MSSTWTTHGFYIVGIAALFAERILLDNDDSYTRRNRFNETKMLKRSECYANSCVENAREELLSKRSYDKVRSKGNVLQNGRRRRDIFEILIDSEHFAYLQQSINSILNDCVFFLSKNRLKSFFRKIIPKEAIRLRCRG